MRDTIHSQPPPLVMIAGLLRLQRCFRTDRPTCFSLLTLQLVGVDLETPHVVRPSPHAKRGRASSGPPTRRKWSTPFMGRPKRHRRPHLRAAICSGWERSWTMVEFLLADPDGSHRNGRRICGSPPPSFPNLLGHVFYEKLDTLPRRSSTATSKSFARNTTPKTRAGNPIPPGVYFRMLFVGYFEELNSQRGIAWRCSDTVVMSPAYEAEMSRSRVCVGQAIQAATRDSNSREARGGATLALRRGGRRELIMEATRGRQSKKAAFFPTLGPGRTRCS